MALKKTMAAYRDANGEWHEQEDVEMGPLEEAAMMCDWACGEHDAKEPKQLSMEEKVNALSNPLQGAAYIASQEAEHQTKYDAWKKECDILRTNRMEKWELYYSEILKQPPGTKTC